MPPRTPSPRLTHFLCIPLVTPTSRPQLSASLTAFRTDPLNSTIPQAAIRPLGTLHLTLGVMSLLTPARVTSALDLLKSLDVATLLSAAAQPSPLDAKASNSTPTAASLPPPAGDSEGGDASAASPHPTVKALEITLRGLVSMHDPTSTSVVYAAPVDASGQLGRFCQALKDAFGSAGLLVPDTRPLLLHATMVNTVYVPGVRKGGGGAGHGKRKARLTMDVRDVLDRYADTTWMEGCRVEKIAVCRMGAKKDLQTGEELYVVEGEVDVPL